MMEATKSRHRDNPAADSGLGLCFAIGGRSLRQREMCTVLVAIADKLAHQAFHMSLIEDDHGIESVSAANSNPALGHTVLPWTSVAGLLRFDAKARRTLRM